MLRYAGGIRKGYGIGIAVGLMLFSFYSMYVSLKAAYTSSLRPHTLVA